MRDETLRPVRWCLLVFALGAVALAVRFAVTWVHDGDATCGALYRHDIWSRSSWCTTVMRERIVLITSLIPVAGLVLYVAATSPRRTWLRRRPRPID